MRRYLAVTCSVAILVACSDNEDDKPRGFPFIYLGSLRIDGMSNQLVTSFPTTNLLFAPLLFVNRGQLEDDSDYWLYDNESNAVILLWQNLKIQCDLFAHNSPRCIFREAIYGTDMECASWVYPTNSFTTCIEPLHMIQPDPIEHYKWRRREEYPLGENTYPISHKRLVRGLCYDMRLTVISPVPLSNQIDVLMTYFLQ